MAMEAVGYNSVERLLRMRGIKRLPVKDIITDTLLDISFPEISGGILDLRFLESSEKESWNEYYLLLEIKKLTESSNYFTEVFKSLEGFMRILENTLPQITSLGVQDFRCELSNYYILIYIIKDHEQ